MRHQVPKVGAWAQLTSNCRVTDCHRAAKLAKRHVYCTFESNPLSLAMQFMVHGPRTHDFATASIMLDAHSATAAWPSTTTNHHHPNRVSRVVADVTHAGVVVQHALSASNSALHSALLHCNIMPECWHACCALIHAF
jgi:hypothetical protein